MINNYEEFTQHIKKFTSIDLSLYKERQMKRRIKSLIHKTGYSNYDNYFNSLKQDKKLLNEFMRHITINVSEFFRNIKHWEVLEHEIVPNLLNSNRELKIWSAACSTGEEPYSLVMLLSKFMPLSRINILATDIDDEVMEKAHIGIYSEKSIQSVPREFVDEFFDKKDDMYRIKDQIKQRVTFKKHNLLTDPYPQNNDLIVCRNVLIYFTEQAKEKVYTEFNNALKQGGVLFVGSTEQIIMCNRYNFSPLKTFFYQKK